MAAHPQVHRNISKLETIEAVEIEHIETFTGVVAGSRSEIAMRKFAAGELVVVEIERAGEEGEVILIVHFQVGRRFERAGDPPLGEIQITVVGIDRVGVTAVGHAVEVRIRVVEAVDATNREGRIEASGEVIVSEGDRRYHRGRGEQHRGLKATRYSLILHD